jgi:hypothetical protein
MADFRAEMQYKNTREQYAVFKFYYLEQGTKKGNPHEYKKYLTWHGKRVEQWVIGRPSADYEAAYKKIRQDNTDEFIQNAREKVAEILAKNGIIEPSDAEKETSYKHDGRVRDYKIHPKVLEIHDKVIDIREDPNRMPKEKTDTWIARELGTTRYWVGQCK